MKGNKRMYPIQQLCATLNNRLWKENITKMIKEYDSLLILQKAGWCVCSLIFKEKAKIPICFRVHVTHQSVYSRNLFLAYRSGTVFFMRN